MIVYVIENRVNGKKYVGKTVCSLNRRWNQHKVDARRGSMNPIHFAMRLYGPMNFLIRTVGHCYSKEVLNDLEKAFIIEFGSHVSTGNGYNVTWGGDGCEPGEKHPWFGGHHSDKTKKILSELKKGKQNPSAKVAGLSHWNRGLVRSEETKQKIREKRALQDMSSRIKTFCKRGHARTPDNVSSNSTCLECKRLLR